MSKTQSQTPSAIRARVRRAAAKAGVLHAMTPAQRVAVYDQADALPTSSVPQPEECVPAISNPGVFAAMASSLTAEEAAAAQGAALAAVSKARHGRRAAPSVKPPDTTRYTLGTYKGRAGAMYEFIKRAGQLRGEHPAGYTREQMVESCALKAPHAAVATRAQVLDYFAWAVRHGLLVVDESPVAAAAGKTSPGAKSPRAGSKQNKKHLSKLLVG